VLVHRRLGRAVGEDHTVRDERAVVHRVAEIAAVRPAVTGRGDTVVVQIGARAPGRSSVAHAQENAVVAELPDEAALKTRGGLDGGPVVGLCARGPLPERLITAQKRAWK
jgi:hypothetical protein